MKRVTVSSEMARRVRASARHLAVSDICVADMLCMVAAESLPRRLTGLPGVGPEPERSVDAGYDQIEISDSSFERLAPFAARVRWPVGRLLDLVGLRDGGFLARVGERRLSPETWAALTEAENLIKAEPVPEVRGPGRPRKN